MSPLYKFLSLPSDEKRVLIRACRLHVFYRILLKTRSFQQVLQQAERKVSHVTKVSKRLPYSRLAHLIKVSGDRIPYITCLSSALVGRVLFAEHGYSTKLHIGVSKSDQAEFEAHAWLSCNDVIVLGQLGDLDKFQEMISIPFDNLS